MLKKEVDAWRKRRGITSLMCAGVVGKKNLSLTTRSLVEVIREHLHPYHEYTSSNHLYHDQ